MFIRILTMAGLLLSACTPEIGLIVELPGTVTIIETTVIELLEIPQENEIAPNQDLCTADEPCITDNLVFWDGVGDPPIFTLPGKRYLATRQISANFSSEACPLEILELPVGFSVSANENISFSPGCEEENGDSFCLTEAYSSCFYVTDSNDERADIETIETNDTGYTMAEFYVPTFVEAGTLNLHLICEGDFVPTQERIGPRNPYQFVSSSQSIAIQGGLSGPLLRMTGCAPVSEPHLNTRTFSNPSLPAGWFGPNGNEVHNP